MRIPGMLMKDYTAELMVRLCARGYASTVPYTMIVAAHPDDEVIGAGSRISYLRGAGIVHITDGSPRNMYDANILGFRTRKGYAQARRKEVLSALRLAGAGAEQCFEAGCVDMETPYNIHEITEKLVEIMKKSRPEAVLTHPYEGGHPDHDTTALCVHLACRILEEEGMIPPRIVEFTSYFGIDGRLVAGGFLPFFESDPITVILTEDERELKKEMMDCFETQRKVLASFPNDIERFRPAPSYDFTKPPHGGKLLYECQGFFEITGPRWRALAMEALDGYGMQGPV